MFYNSSCRSCSFLTLVMIDRDAPWSKRTEATSSCPSRAERCRGVYPDVVAALGDAPCCSSCCTISAFPRRAEMCSGVWSSWTQSEQHRPAWENCTSCWDTKDLPTFCHFPKLQMSINCTEVLASECCTLAFSVSYHQDTLLFVNASQNIPDSDIIIKVNKFINFLPYLDLPHFALQTFLKIKPVLTSWYLLHFTATFNSSINYCLETCIKYCYFCAFLTGEWLFGILQLTFP